MAGKSEPEKRVARFKREIRREKERLLEVLSPAAPELQVSLAPVVDNVAWMKVQLDRARALIEMEEIVVPYDNGGGQSGLRENPAYKGYESLWKAYMSGVDRLIGALPERDAAEIATPDAPPTVLELVRQKHGAEA